MLSRRPGTLSALRIISLFRNGTSVPKLPLCANLARRTKQQMPGIRKNPIQVQRRPSARIMLRGNKICDDQRDTRENGEGF